MPASYCRRDEPQFLGHGRFVANHITCAEDALGVIHLAHHHPARPEVIALVLEERHGRSVAVVDGAEDPDAVVSVVEVLSHGLVASDRPGELVMATVRPDVGPLPGDADRWMEASAIAEEFGCELLEWFVITAETAWCPRDLLAEAPRW
jgi:hypothetical protein